MNRDIFIGIVCEGKLDYLLLDTVLHAFVDQKLTVALMAPQPELAHEGFGWKSVVKWAKTLGEPIFANERNKIGQLDLLIVQLDQDICGRDEFAGCTGPEQMCDIVKEWLQPVLNMDKVVICLPKHSTDAWLLAAVDAGVDAENEMNPSNSMRRFGIAKNPRAYERHRPHLALGLASLRPRLPELDRFLTKLAVALTPKAA